MVLVKHSILFLLCGLTSFICMADTSQENTKDLASGAQTWSIDHQGVHFSLTQILPDQVRAFFVGRGFTLKQVEPYATSCVFMTVLRNDNAPGRIHFVRDKWSINSGDNTSPPEKTSRWLEKLKKYKVKNSALIAFRWAQFPSEQTYEPGGDWNQGMLSAGLAADSRFDIIARWDIAGKSFAAKLEDVSCAK